MKSVFRIFFSMLLTLQLCHAEALSPRKRYRAYVLQESEMVYTKLEAFLADLKTWEKMQTLFARTFKDPQISADLKVLAESHQKNPLPAVKITREGHEIIVSVEKTSARFDLQARSVSLGKKTMIYDGKSADEIYRFFVQGPSTTFFNSFLQPAYAEPFTIIAILTIAAVAIALDFIASLWRESSCTERVSRFAETLRLAKIKCSNLRNSTYETLIEGLSVEEAQRIYELAFPIREPPESELQRCANDVKAFPLFAKNMTLLISGTSGSCVPDSEALSICRYHLRTKTCEKSRKTLARVNNSERGTATKNRREGRERNQPSGSSVRR